MTTPYTPVPLNTSGFSLPEELQALLEDLARHIHDVWARRRLDDGWTWGPSRDDAARKHPCLVPYEQLPESEKEYDRATARETIQAILAFGYQITR